VRRRIAVLASALAVAGLLSGFTVSPVLADYDHDHDRGHGHWRHHEHHDDWHHGQSRYYYRGSDHYYYAPRVEYYSPGIYVQPPPPPSWGLNLVFPIH
jgi:hypothetical protein